jgi:peptidoglycan/xylan/chitin deacetylase (PgdA/CDA1 family)
MIRFDRVLRLFAVAFLLGAVLGLGGGLVLGGPDTVADADAVDATSADPVGEATTSPAVDEPMTAERAKAIGANELGRIMVLEYHKIGTPESQWTRTPENFRKDVALLQAEGFYPINVRDLFAGNIDVPAGKTPVVITFDDSSPGQFRILEDDTVDPDSAVGILQEAAKSDAWASRATFFPLLDVQPNDNVLFGQPDLQKQKVRELVQWGYELGSHTVTHLNLKEASTAEATKQLAVSQQTIEDMVGNGYSVESISIPFGEYPAEDALLTAGEYEGVSYSYRAAVEVSGASSASPYSTEFAALHIPRIQGTGDALEQHIAAFKKQPELRYISDGDPTAISVPSTIDAGLGDLIPDLGRPIIRY